MRLGALVGEGKTTIACVSVEDECVCVRKFRSVSFALVCSYTRRLHNRCRCQHYHLPPKPFFVAGFGLLPFRAATTADSRKPLMPGTCAHDTTQTGTGHSKRHRSTNNTVRQWSS